MIKIFGILCFLWLVGSSDSQIGSNENEQLFRLFLQNFGRNGDRTTLAQAASLLNELGNTINIQTILQAIGDLSINDVDNIINTPAVSAAFGDLPISDLLNQINTNLCINNSTKSFLKSVEQGIDTIRQNVNRTSQRNTTTQGLNLTELQARIKEQIRNLPECAQTFSVSPPSPSNCINDTNSILPNLLTTDWAFKMIDAAGKLPAGMANFKLTWLGDYDECVGIKADTFNGQYCLIDFLVPSIPNPITQQNGIAAKIGFCMPDSCSEDENKVLLNSVVPRLSNNQVYISDVKCQKPDKPYDKRAVIVLVVIGVFGTIMIAATAFDLIINHLLPKRKRSRNYKKDESKNEKNRKNGKQTVDSHGNIGFEHDPDEDGYIKKEPINAGIEFEPDQKGTAEIELGTKDNEEPKPQQSDTRVKVTDTNYHKPGIPVQLLLSFSLYTNTQRILSTRQGSGTLTAINGIRFISMTWVILGHTFAFGVQAGIVDNVATAYPEFIGRKTFMAIANATVAVDTFFTLSGLLLTFLVLKQLKKGNGRLNWFMFYFHRFWRLTPPYMLVMMVYIALTPYLGSGPLWNKDGFEKNYCKDSWWYNLLYINNFLSATEQCFAWAWYLANDMQFYVISPIIILPLFFSKLAGTIVTTLFLLGTTIVAGVISKHFELGASGFDRNAQEHFDYYYQKPYCRMGPYLVGIYTGYLLYKTDCKYKINGYKNFVLWVVFALVACLVLYGPYENYNGNLMSVDTAAFYNAIHRTAWGASVSWVIFACATGNGGFVNKFLSWKMFIPLGRLTYCAYLIHPIVQYFFYLSRKQLLYWDDHQVIYEYLGHLVISYAAAFVASLAFESPMMGLEKVIFRKK